MAVKNKQIIKEIKDGNEEVLLYLFKKEYAALKKYFYSGGADEKEIPALVAGVVVKVWMEIHKNDFSENIDLTSYLLNTAKENAKKYSSENKVKRKIKQADQRYAEGIDLKSQTQQEIIAECVNVLEAASRKALQWRYAENYSIEQVAQKLKIDAASAQDVISKAFAQLTSIAKIRMEHAA